MEKHFVAIKVQQHVLTEDFARMAIKWLDSYDAWTMWVDLPMTPNQQRMPWFPFYRLVCMNYSVEPTTIRDKVE
jgi:hypothetical protein